MIFALFVYFSVRYGHRILDGWLAFMEHSQATQQSLAESYKVMSERDDCTKTNRALGHAFHAAKEASKCPDVHKHLDRAIDALQ